MAKCNFDQKLAVRGGPRAVDRITTVCYQIRRKLAARLWPLHTEGTGAMASRFERAFAQLTGSKHALMMNSGTAALHSALFAVGVGPGDEVILPSYTFHASASAILCCGATPVFCDIDLRTLTADPQDIKARISERTRAIMVVHVWGNPAEMDTICAIAAEHQIPIVEDCSHAHGASYQEVPVGRWGAVGAFSLQGQKAVSGGEAGIAVCDDPVLFDRMLALGHPFRVASSIQVSNFGLGSIQLGPKYRPHLHAVYLAQKSLRQLPELNEERRSVWKVLCQELDGVESIRPTETLPGAIPGGFLCFLFALSPNVDRDLFLRAASAEGVPLAVDRYEFLHDKPVFSVGGPLSAARLDQIAETHWERKSLRNVDLLRNRLVSLPGLPRFSARIARSFGRALNKVGRQFDFKEE